jgi:nucleoside-diphosphate-sugar epimerase
MVPVLAISGTSGFVASACVAHCTHLGLPCVSLRRSAENSDRSRAIGAMDGSPIPPGALTNCSVIIHAAARAHVLRETDPDPLATFRRANTASTIRLAEAAIAAGVRRFVFISSIGVLGNHSTGQALRPGDQLNPIEDYARSKAEAEEGLRTLCEQAGMELVIVRPPLVHGPGAKGNFQRLMAAIYAGKRLPLGGVDNRRSFVGVENLADALLVAAMAELPADSKHVGERTADVSNRPRDVGQEIPIAPQPTEVGRPCRLKSALRSQQALTYHIADDGVISTRRLVEVLAEGMGVQPRLINVPRWLAVGGATLLGKGAMARRLFDDLEVDDSDFRRDFGWKPTIGLEDGLRTMAADYAKRMREGRSDG